MLERLLVSLLVVTCLIGPSPAWAQGGIAEINGAVVDQSQGVLPGVTVVVTNVGTSATRTVVTGPDGRFIVPTLTPGIYSVAVELAGFQPQTRENVDLRVGQEVTLAFTLAVGGLAENLTVTGQAPVVEVTTNRIATQIGTQEIDNLPTQGRNTMALLSLVPGVTPTVAPGGFGEGRVTANGRDGGSNTFLIDGMSNQQALRGGALGGQAPMALDAMAEYQVLTHNYTAEYGGLSGIVVNSVSRSGTNQFRGRAFTYLQDDKLNAVEHFAKLEGLENPDSGLKIFGGNIGGPIVRDRAFLFANYERNMFDEAVSLTFPSEAAPLATAYTDTATNRSNNVFFRVDFLASPNHTLSGRYLDYRNWEIGDGWEEDRSLPENVEYERNVGDRTYNTAWTWVIANSATNEMKVGRITQDTRGGAAAFFDEDVRWIAGNTREGIMEFDQFTIGSGNAHPDYNAGPATAHGSSIESNYTWDNTFTMVRSGLGGDHTFKAGTGYFRGKASPKITGANFVGSFLFPTNLPFDPANARTYPSQFSIRLGSIYTFAEDHRTYAFVQDRWQMDNLTLNLGLRWDYQTLTPNTKAALGPRLGVAWDPRGSGRTVIRGGFGKNYETENLILKTGLIEGDVAAYSFIFQTDQDESGLAGRIPANPCLQPSMGRPGIAVIGPACRTQLAGIRSSILADQFVNTEPLLDNPDRVLPYVWSFSVGVKHEIMTDLAVSADYVGNRGRDITAVVDINEPRTLPNGSRGRPGVNVFDPNGTLIPAQFRNATFQRVLQFQNSDAFNTDHNALELSLEKRYSNRWGGRVAYTLSESHDVQGGVAGGFNLSLKRFSDDLDPRSDYGRAAFDNRHTLSSSVNVTPWRGLGVGAVYRFYSGNPINELVGRDVNGDRDNFDRPVAGADDLTMPIRSKLDASGRAVRNGIDGPNVWNVDFRSQYSFSLPAQRTVGVFWEIYNVTNKVNFAAPTGNRRSSNFLVPTAAFPPRSMQIGLRFDF
ncbi:MAG: TonB-dependent receptor [Acidobacteria bacterium]|nr:TonB-dependent receptor [Acidobacteriota bacterium]